jgi:Fe-S cluster biogenesis protein NfuA
MRLAARLRDGGSASAGSRRDVWYGRLRGMDAAPRELILKMCREILAPLVHADGGEMYLVAVGTDEVHVHLAGTCAGCPGASLTRDRLLEPAFASVAPKLTLKVTTGWLVPAGSERV